MACVYAYSNNYGGVCAAGANGWCTPEQRPAPETSSVWVPESIQHAAIRWWFCFGPSLSLLYCDVKKDEGMANHGSSSVFFIMTVDFKERTWRKVQKSDLSLRGNPRLVTYFPSRKLFGRWGCEVFPMTMPMALQPAVPEIVREKYAKYWCPRACGCSPEKTNRKWPQNPHIMTYSTSSGVVRQ